jgi:preprotein translocase subunit SecD
MEKLMRNVSLFCGLILALMATLKASPTTQPTDRFQIRLVAVSTNDPNAEELPMANTLNNTLHVLKRVELDDRDIDSVKPGGPSDDGQPSISVTFTEDGAKKLSALTANNADRRLAIVFGNKVLSAPRIVDPIGRNAIITLGRYTPASASTDLAKALKEIIDARGAATAPASK